MAAPLFTLKAGDGLHSRIGDTQVPLAGAKLILKTNIREGDLVVIDDGLEKVEDVFVTLDANGKINADTGISILADDPSLGLSAPLQWQVNVIEASSQGFSRMVRKWWFDAGTNGQTVNLDDVPPVPVQIATS